MDPPIGAYGNDFFQRRGGFQFFRNGADVPDILEPFDDQRLPERVVANSGGANGLLPEKAQPGQSGRLVSVFVLRDLAAKRLRKENPEKKYYNRFGVSVTKRVGGAVQRSRVKRILRAGYRAVEPELKTGYLVVISPREGILSAKSTDVEKELRYGFRRLDMFRVEGK
jgi:ribonuclease P protein component